MRKINTQFVLIVLNLLTTKKRWFFVLTKQTGDPDMKPFKLIAITSALLAYENSATAIVSGITCNTGQVCCYYNNAGGCMKCASPGACPTCMCPIGYDATTWTATDTNNQYARCLQVTASAAAEICGLLYSCAAGYYLTDTNTCERCPSSGGVHGTTPEYNTSGITSCYIPAGDISFTDDTGTYVCGENSYYTN